MYGLPPLQDVSIKRRTLNCRRIQRTRKLPTIMLLQRHILPSLSVLTREHRKMVTKSSCSRIAMRISLGSQKSGKSALLSLDFITSASSSAQARSVQFIFQYLKENLACIRLNSAQLFQGYHAHSVLHTL